MKKYLINTELKNELEDLYNILIVNNVQEKDIVFCINEKIVNCKNNFKGIKKVYIEKNFTSNKIISRLMQLLYFFYVLLREKPNFLVTGSSIFKHRIFTKLLSIEHIAYFRGLLFDSRNTTGGLADKLRYGKFKFLFKSYIFNTFEADKIIITSEINKKYLTQRGIESKKIYITRPVWLNHGLINNNKQQQLIFLTQAFEWHGYSKQHEEQILFLDKILEWTQKNEIILLIRIHPRDNHDYSSFANNINTTLSKDDYSQFLTQISNNDIVISPLSTMAFELMYLKIHCCFYSTNSLNTIYGSSFKKLKITTIEDSIFNNIHTLNDLMELSCELEIFSKNTLHLEFIDAK